MVHDGTFPVRGREVGGRYRVTKVDLLRWLGYPAEREAARQRAGAGGA